MYMLSTALTSLSAKTYSGPGRRNRCGKTTTALSIMNLVPDPPGVIKSGTIKLEGKNVLEMSERELEEMRGNDVA
mgnify:CR=1 FL=1